MKYTRFKLVIFFRHLLWAIKHWRLLVIHVILFLTVGCGLTKYSTTLILPDGEKVTLEGNVASSAEGNGYKIDQRGLSVIEKLIPQSIRIEK
jgi:hypothetical protein